MTGPEPDEPDDLAAYPAPAAPGVPAIEAADLPPPDAAAQWVGYEASHPLTWVPEGDEGWSAAE